MSIYYHYLTKEEPVSLLQWLEKNNVKLHVYERDLTHSIDGTSKFYCSAYPNLWSFGDSCERCLTGEGQDPKSCLLNFVNKIKGTNVKIYKNDSLPRKVKVPSSLHLNESPQKD